MGLPVTTDDETKPTKKPMSTRGIMAEDFSIVLAPTFSREARAADLDARVQYELWEKHDDGS
jgi:hypothetical protein